MTFSYQSHFPGFFLSPESHFIGFFKSYKMAVGTENKGPPCFLLLWGYRQLLGQQQHKRQLDAVVDVLAVVDDLAVVNNCRKAPVLLWTVVWPIPAYDKPELARPRKVILRRPQIMEEDQLPKVIFRGQAIPACPQPELIGIFKLTFRGLQMPGKWLWLDKVISEILKPLKLVLWSSRETVSLKKNLKLAGPLV